MVLGNSAALSRASDDRIPHAGYLYNCS
jgi:hypothetical protein